MAPKKKQIKKNSAAKSDAVATTVSPRAGITKSPNRSEFDSGSDDGSLPSLISDTSDDDSDVPQLKKAKDKAKDVSSSAKKGNVGYPELAKEFAKTIIKTQVPDIKKENNNDSDSDVPPDLVSSSDDDDSSDDDNHHRRNATLPHNFGRPSKKPASFPSPAPTSPPPSSMPPAPVTKEVKITKTQKAALKKKEKEATEKLQELQQKREKEAAAAENMKRQQQHEEEQRRLLQELQQKREKEAAAAENMKRQQQHEEEQRRLLAAQEARLRLQNKTSIIIQRVFRGYRARCDHGAALKARMRVWEEFKFSWGSITKELSSNTPHLFSWFDEKNRFDYVLNSSDLELARDSESEVTSDLQKRFQDITTEEVRKVAFSSSATGGGGETEAKHGDEEEHSVKRTTNSSSSESRREEVEEQDSIDNPYIREMSDTNCPDVAPVLNIEFTETVMKWLQNADSRYREMFSDRIERLAQGERSYMLAKRLQGCTSPVFETKLDAGQRILWTQLQRANENPSIIVWFVSKHDKVPHFIQIMNKFFDRLKNTLNTEGVIRSTGVFREGAAFVPVGDTIELTEDMCLLDPLRNSPLKIYISAAKDVKLIKAKKINVSKFPLRLNQMEKDVNKHTGTVLLLGRSGTGKTVCLCNRMAKDRIKVKTVHGEPISQLFVCRSRRLRNVVKRFYDTHCRIVMFEEDEINLEAEEEERRLEVEKELNQANFFTLDRFIDHMDEVISRECGPCHREYGRNNHMDFVNFRDNFYPQLRYKGRPTKLDPLVLWTQIRTHIKSSFEAWRDIAVIPCSTGAPKQCRGMLSLEVYMNEEKFPPSRCRLDKTQRVEAYDLFTKYQDALFKENMWDDADRVMDLLLRYDDNRVDCEMNYTGKGGPYHKIYVDEIQDSTQAEITLFFLCCGFEFDSLFLAGDNAQSVVEGVDFRFEEVRSIIYALNNDSKKKEMNKPVTLVTNFRSHTGILNCATGILDMMFGLFPHAAKVLERDRGFCKGPRPVYFFDLDHKNSTLRHLLTRNPRMVALFRDEYDLLEERSGAETKELDGIMKTVIPDSILKLGIKDAKGMEFDDVVLVDFFCGLSGRTQEWWKKRFQNTAASPVAETEMPQMESLFKLLYTGITRCCNRLIFVETQDKPASRAFFRWLKVKEFADPYAPPPSVIMSAAGGSLKDGGMPMEISGNSDDGEVFMCNDDWRLRGIELLLATEQGSSNLQLFKNAQLCFERAGESARFLLTKVQVHIEAEALKTKFMQYFNKTRGWEVGSSSQTMGTPLGLTGGDIPTVKEVAALMLKCIREGLLPEASLIAELMRSCLGNKLLASHFKENVSDPLKYIENI